MTRKIYFTCSLRNFVHSCLDVFDDITQPFHTNVYSLNIGIVKIVIFFYVQPEA